MMDLTSAKVMNDRQFLIKRSFLFVTYFQKVFLEFFLSNLFNKIALKTNDCYNKLMP